MRVNLAPDSRMIFADNWFQIFFTIFYTILVISLAANYYCSFIEIKNLESKLSDINNQLAIYTPQKQEYFEINKKIEGIKQLSEEKQESNIVFSPIIKELGFIVPDKLAFQLLNYNGDIMVITGRAINSSGVISLISNLKKSLFFKEVNLRNIDQREEVQFQLEVHLAGRD